MIPLIDKCTLSSGFNESKTIKLFGQIVHIFALY